MQYQPEGETVLSSVLDQAAPHGVFVKIRDLGLYLISVNRIRVSHQQGPDDLKRRKPAQPVETEAQLEDMHQERIQII